MLESLVDCEGEEPDYEPEADAAEVVVPGERTGDFLYFGDGHFVWDRITLDDSDGVAKKLVTILDGHVFDEDSVRFQSPMFQGCSASSTRAKSGVKASVIVTVSLLEDVDAVVLMVGHIYGIDSDIMNELSDVLRCSTPDEG